MMEQRVNLNLIDSNVHFVIVSQGIESISDYAITFHYVSVQLLYNLEFYLYHFRPYGIVSGLQDLNTDTKQNAALLQSNKST